MLLKAPSGVAALLGQLRRCGANQQAATLSGRAAAHVSLDDLIGVASLLTSLPEAEAITTLAARVVARVTLNRPSGVAVLLIVMWVTGAGPQATELAGRAAAQAPVDDPSLVVGLDVLPHRHRSWIRARWPCCWTACSGSGW